MPQTMTGHNQYTCPFCSGFACVTKNALDLHIAFNHSERKIVSNNDSNEAQKNQLSCPVSECSKKFKGQHEIDAHVLLNHKEIRYSCTNCHRIFTDKGVLILHLKLVHEIDKPDLRLPLVNTSKELVGYIDIKNVQAKQKSNQIETHEPEEVENSDDVSTHTIAGKDIEPVILEDDDIIEKIDDMIEKIDNESDDDDGIEIIGESNEFQIQSSTSNISKAKKSDKSPSTVQDNITQVFVECDNPFQKLNANDPDYDPFGVDPNDLGLKLVEQVNKDHHDNIAVSDDSDDEQTGNPFCISEVHTIMDNEDLGTPVLQQSDLILACDECFEIFTSKFALSQHMIKVHPKVMSKDPSRYDHILVPTRKIGKKIMKKSRETLFTLKLQSAKLLSF